MSQTPDEENPLADNQDRQTYRREERRSQTPDEENPLADKHKKHMQELPLLVSDP